MSKLVNTLTEDEFVLVRETKKPQMAGLDEDELIELHTRVRRARNKYVKLYRRSGADKVDKKKSRATGRSAQSVTPPQCSGIRKAQTASRWCPAGP